MRRWVVRDRDGREIYMTEERWGHITVRHEELDGHLDNVLETLRWGKRRQDKRDPQTYTYYRRCKSLTAPYDHIIVAVAFRFHESTDGTTVPNNFVVSAWGKHIPSRS